MLTISFNAKAALKKLERAEIGVKSMDKFIGKAEKFVRAGTKQQFETEGRYMTARWARLKPSSIRARAAKGYGGKPILQNTGRLKSNYFVKYRTSSMLVWGTDVPYAKYHQLGTSKMKARKILAINKTMREGLKDIFSQYINELIR